MENNLHYVSDRYLHKNSGANNFMGGNKMILCATQPAYLSWLGFFHKAMLADIFVILDDVQFERNSFINRNKIKTSDGPQWLTIPLKMDGHLDRTIKDMEIADDRWRKKHWQTIYNAYHRAPYFKEYEGFFDRFYSTEHMKLIHVTEYLARWLFEVLDINTKVVQQSDFNITSHKQDLILNLCERFDADIFIFGSQGREYADVGIFKQHGIKCYFQDYQHPTYPQQWGDFVPNMSIIDLLFNVGADRAREIIQEGNITKSKLLED
jgi:hypothetical protein